MRKKKLYEGQFNYAQCPYIFFTHSFSKEEAFLNFITQMSKKFKIKKRNLQQFIFNGEKDNYFIQERRKQNDKS